MNNRELGEKILDGLGGPENIAHITHCATRLRVTPVSNDAVQNKKIESLPGVLSVIEQSGQTQVVLGDRVEAVYNEINALPSMSGTLRVTPRLRLRARSPAGLPTSSTFCLTPSVLCCGHFWVPR